MNDRLWGTLERHARRAAEARGAIRRVARRSIAAIVDLRYGTVAINHWPALGYAFGTTPWGGHQSATLENIQSGLGWVHNTYMLDGIDKAVVRGPLVVKPDADVVLRQPEGRPGGAAGGRSRGGAELAQGAGAADARAALIAAMIVVLMGVTGSGKTTVGRLLAGQLGWTFVEGDDFHPPANVEKMRRGEPLTDADRVPWLRALRARHRRAGGGGAVGRGDVLGAQAGLPRRCWRPGGRRCGSST